MNSKKSFVVVANKMLIVTVLFWGISLRASTTNKPVEKENQEIKSKEIIFKRVAQYIENEKKATQDEISALEKDIIQSKEAIYQLNKGVGNYTPKERKKAIKTMNDYIIEIRKKVQRLKNGYETVPPELPYAKLMVGQIGSIKAPREDEFFSYKIFQIIDDNNFLLDIRIKVLDKSVALSPFWIKGISTSLLVDNMEYCPKGIFCVTGTKQYTTITGGSKTVFVLQPLDIESLKKEYENQIKNKQNNKKASR